LARNFKEARDALRGKRRVTPATKESVKSMMMTNGIRLPIDFSTDNGGKSTILVQFLLKFTNLKKIMDLSISCHVDKTLLRSYTRVTQF